MKKLYLFLCLALFSTIIGCEDAEVIFVDEEVISTTYEGSIHLNTQDQVNTFVSKGYLRINGNLTIGSYIFEETNISDISGLSTLTEVTGTLYLLKNTSLMSLQGLENITNVGRLSMQGNGVQNIDAVANIVTATDLRIDGNANLMQLPTFTGNTSLRNLEVSGSPLLTDLTGLENIESVENLDIKFNTNLTSLEGLSSLQTVSGRIQIEGNDSLIDLKGLESFTTCELLYIFRNDNLQELTGVENFTEISRGISIYDNPALISLDYFDNLTKVGDNPNNSGIIVSYNDSLENLNGLQGITSFAGAVYVQYNDNLTNLCDLQNILNGTTTLINIQFNAYNPSDTDIAAGVNCSI